MFSSAKAFTAACIAAISDLAVADQPVHCKLSKNKSRVLKHDSVIRCKESNCGVLDLRSFQRGRTS